MILPNQVTSSDWSRASRCDCFALQVCLCSDAGYFRLFWCGLLDLQQAGAPMILDRQKFVLVMHDEIEIAGEIGTLVCLFKLDGIVGLNSVLADEMPMAAGRRQP